MDVVCQRCRAEYEFDDALISALGTTVRCTSCGFQFKVYPETGASIEQWTLTPASGEAPRVFDSLRDLQRAIARGGVETDDLLARGGEAPRRIDEIVELVPLLRYGKSQPPPSVVASGPASPEPAPLIPKAARLPAESFGAPRAPTGTVMGIAVPQKAVAASALAPPESIPAPPTSVRPRIRSALSMGPAETRREGTPAAHSGFHEDAPPSSRHSVPPPQASLRSVVGRDSVAPSPDAPSSSSRQSAPPASHSPDSPRPDSPRPDSPRYDAAQKDAPRQDSRPDSPRPDSPRMAGPPRAPFEAPRIASPPAFPRDVTPTPASLVRATRDSMPVSSIPGTGRARSARGVWVVVAVGLGAASFAYFVSRDKLDQRSTTAMASAAASADAAEVERRAMASVEAVRRADEQWLRMEMAGSTDRSEHAVALERALAEADAALAVSGVDGTDPVLAWLPIHVLRMKGRLAEARGLLGALSPAAREDGLGHALLDLAEPRAERPYALILRRLELARTGERERFFARSVYVYALGESGDVTRAGQELDTIGKLSGGAESPHFVDLGRYLERRRTELGSAPMASVDTAGLTNAPEATPSADAAPAAPPEPAAPEAEPPSPAASAAHEPAAEPEAAPKPVAPKAPEPSDAVKAKMSQADALWGQGEHEAAVALYRQVVTELGTKHFLGQRASARIAQSSREAGTE